MGMQQAPFQQRQSHLRTRRPIRHIVERSHRGVYQCEGLNRVGM